jgi:hypothetical protein
MRQMISGLVAAFAVVAASAAPAMACGMPCSPCGQAYVSPCGQPQVYIQSETYERLPNPELQYHVAPTPRQYYYADQGPTFTGPGNFAPYPVYQESQGPAVYGYGYGYHHHMHSWHRHMGYRYGYVHHSMRYGYHTPHHYGYREHVLRRYY